MKIKTSVAIDDNLLIELKREAKAQERPVSYIINKLIESRLFPRKAHRRARRKHENASETAPHR